MEIYSIHEYSAVIKFTKQYCCTYLHGVSSCCSMCIPGSFEHYWASYKKWKVREGEEIEGRKPSWFTGKTHHTLSTLKWSYALWSVQELTSNRPDASSDWQTDQKTIHSPSTRENATTFQSFSSAIFPSWPAMTPLCQTTSTPLLGSWPPRYGPSNLKSSSTSMKFHYKTWCKLFNNVLSVWWYIKFYDVFLIFFRCFTAAQSNAIHSNSRVDQLWHQPSVTQPCSQVTSRWANQQSSFEFSSFEFIKLISYSQHISALVFAFQSCSAQFVAMSGHTLQFLRYRKEKVDLCLLFITVSFRSVSDSDVTRKSESMTVGVMAGQLGNMAEEKLWNVVAFSPVFGEWMVFWSVCWSEEASGLLLVSSWTNRRVWLDFMAESVWCVFPVNQDGFLPSISSPSLTFHFL